MTLRLPPSCSSCWLYCLGVTLVPAPLPTSGHFKLDTVDSLLSSSSQPLSEKAQQFRNMIQAFQATGPLASQAMAAPGLMASLGGHSGVIGDKSSLSQEPNGSPESGDSGGQSKPESAPSGSSGDFQGGSLVFLKSYIDSKFSCLEDKLIGAIDAAEKRQESKLDKILGLLQTQSSHIGLVKQESEKLVKLTESCTLTSQHAEESLHSRTDEEP